jgi:tetratricopeptide (TPR) repeat protein
MRKNKLIDILFIVLLITISISVMSCKKSQKEKIAQRKDVSLKPVKDKLRAELLFFDNLQKIDIVEIGSDNIAIWAKNGIRERTLVLLDPALNIGREISDDLLLEAKQLIDNNEYDKLDKYTGITNTLKRLYGPYNYVYAAYRLGIIKDVVWVLPITESITYDYQDFFRQRLREDEAIDFTNEDINSFTYADNKLTGTVFGIPVTVTALHDLEMPEDYVVISINMTYLTTFVENNIQTPIEEITVAFVNKLSKKPLMSNYLTIVNSNRTFEVDLIFRFITKILKDMLMDLNLMKNPKLEWNVKIMADEKLAFVDYEQAEKEYNAILQMNPDNAGVYYQLAILYLKRRDFEKTSYYLEEAIKRDKYYSLGYVSLLSKLGNNGYKEELINLGLANHPEDISILTTFANMKYKSGKYKEAQKTYLKLISMGLESYNLSFYVADCYYRLKEFERAGEVYERTLSLLPNDYKEAYVYYYISLAEVYEKLKDNENAIKNYELYLKFVKDSTNTASIKSKIKMLKQK